MTIPTPQIDKIIIGTDIGRSYRNKYIGAACPTCGKTRWVFLNKGKPQHAKCRSCTQIGNIRHWKGGRTQLGHGYIGISLNKSDFFFPMVTNARYVLEHRLVMAKHLGRLLQPWEIVHHINGVKDDNRIENLQLIGEMQHCQTTIVENRISVLESKILLLEADNIALREQLREEQKCQL
jgi:hypothetical protein